MSRLASSDGAIDVAQAMARELGLAIRRADRLFGVGLVVQWVILLAMAVAYTPRTWVEAARRAEVLEMVIILLIALEIVMAFVGR
jgi:hypothetical protein